MTSEATAMSKPVCRGMPLSLPPRPTTISRRQRSFRSTTRFHWMVRGSMFRGLPCIRLVSSAAEHRLWAMETAWMSPVKCRFRSSIGTIWE